MKLTINRKSLLKGSYLDFQNCMLQGSVHLNPLTIILPCTLTLENQTIVYCLYSTYFKSKILNFQT